MNAFWEISRAAVTVICFVSFILILLSAYSKKSKKRYDAEANRLLADDDTPHGAEPSHGVKQ